MNQIKTGANRMRTVFILLIVFLGGWFSFAYYIYNNQIFFIAIQGTIDDFQEAAFSLHQAAIDRNVKAVIMYLNTPGGLASACMEIAKYVAEVNKVKPVIAVMGPVCASGGYYIASFATYIFAHSNTVTGSIGVIAVWVDNSKYYENQGINITIWSTGPEKDFGADWRPPTKEEFDSINSTVHAIFQTLLSDIQRNRSLTKDTIDKVITGGTFSGDEAIQLNLADKIGDIINAVEEVIRRTGMWRFIVVSPYMDEKQKFLAALF